MMVSCTGTMVKHPTNVAIANVSNPTTRNVTESDMSSIILEHCDR
jgi:hypothetical protein